MNQQARTRRGPSNRTRFVARARTLKEDRDFLTTIEQFRARWDARYPQFAIGKPGFPPEQVRTLYGQPMPAALMQLFETWHASLGSPDPTGERTDFFVEYNVASTAWGDKLMAICEEFWPPEDFPHGLGDWNHPASVFVGACVLYEIRFVNEAFVFSYPLQVERYPANPYDRDSDPFKVQDTEKIRFLEGRISDAIRERRAVSPDEMTGWLREAERVSYEKAKPLFSLYHYNEQSGWFCVPLMPEITSLDWRDAETQVLKRVREVWGDDFVGSRIVHWKSQNKSIGWIARRLGVDERTVSSRVRHLRPSDADALDQ